MSNRHELGKSGVVRPLRFHSSDRRGSFAKVWQASEEMPDLEFREIFWTRSQRGVIRGMHLQVKPAGGAKLVWVCEGQVTDVVLDLRPSSPTFGEWDAFDLTSESDAVLVPEGYAHGFEVRSEWATVNYAQTCLYAPASDTGVRWDSFGYPWSTATPLVSERDMGLPDLATFAISVARNQ